MDEHSAKLSKIFGAVELSPSDEIVWQTRQELHDTANAVVLKISTLPSDLCLLCSELQDWAAQKGVEIAVVAQANGLVTATLKTAPDAAIAIIDQLRERLRKVGGSVVALQVPGPLRNSLDVWGCESNALPLMKEIKRRFDPNRILNPGLFVGNI